MAVSMTQTEMAVSGAPGGGGGSGSGAPPCPRAAKRRRWGGLRQQWKLLGLFEIDQQHEFHSLTVMMKEGLAAAVQNSIDNPPPEELSDADFRLEVTQIHQGFRMDTFAGPVFSVLRRSLGLTEKEYQHSLCSDCCYLQFISNSKSKADFFLSNDKRFFVKTQNQREVRFLLSNLRIYMKHLEKYPHSLLVKFLGAHMIKIPQRKKKYFIVMQSVFYPDDRITTRYDIKGCEVSRWTEPAPEGSQVIVVLKDLNFEGQFITLGQQRAWLVRQVQEDTAFLQRLSVLDYSLLLASQTLHHDERPGLSLATLIMRTKKSVIASSSPTHAAAPTVPGTVTEEEEEDPLGPLGQMGRHSGVRPGTAQTGTALVHPGTVVVQPAGAIQPAPGSVHPGGTAVPDSAELPDFQAQNRRLLPNFKNPLHVIDGPEQRYFVGIIDIFTVYGFRKRLEHLWKRLRHPGRTFSTVSPPAYCLRLCRWVQDHTK